MARTKQPARQGPSPGACGRKRNKGQSTLEYGIIIACVVAALLAMQVYVKRGMQGRVKSTADELGQQYDPRKVTGSTTTTYNSVTTTQAQTLSERQLNAKYPGQNIDLNGDGDYDDDDVYATETASYLGRPVTVNGVLDHIEGGSTTTQVGGETVGNMERNLF